MAPQYDAITGGTVLRIPALQSPNFLTGVSGWIIRGDGTCEFNAGVFRGSVQIGVPATVILANPATGDAVDVYDGSGNLLYSIDGSGRARAYSAGFLNTYAEMRAAFFDLINSDAVPGNVSTGIVQLNPGSFTAAAQLILEALNSSFNTYELILQSGSSTTGPTAVGSERNVSGSLVQCDQVATNNLVRFVPKTNFTSNGAGVVSYTHGLSFTPTGSIFQICLVSQTVFLFFDTYTSTTATGKMFVSNGAGAVLANATLPFQGVFFG